MVTAKAALLVAMIAMGAGVVGWGIPSAGSSCSPLCDHARFTVQFSLSGSPSKYSLDADPNLVTGLANTTVRQGQFPASVNLYVWYVWCDTTVSGGKLVLQQTGGGAGWAYSFSCGTGQSSNGNPGSTSVLFTQALAGNNNYDIIEQNTNSLADTMHGGFVVSTTNTNQQNILPGSVAIQTIFQIKTGQTLHVWFESGSAAGCGAGSLICYIGINPVVSGSNCRLDLSGGSFTTMGSPDSTVDVCTIAGNTSFAWESVASNTDTTPHLISGLFVVSIY